MASASASASETDPITSHVLDQTSGTPAEGVSMTLWLLAPPDGTSQSAPPSPLPASPPALDVFRATTAAGSGRVSRWTHDPASATITTGPDAAAAGETRLAHVLQALRETGHAVSEWVLVLDTEAYWKTGKRGKTFYPRVRIEFTLDQEEGRDHWHVPVLLGPHGFTTYRGT